MMKAIQILLVEDAEADFLLIERQIRQSELKAEICWVRGADELSGALQNDKWDVVLTDYSVPGIDFSESLLHIRGKYPQIPVILVSGTIGEETAVELMKKGLNDFVLKDRLFRLVPALIRSLSEQYEREKRKDAERKLQKNEQLMRAVLEGTSDAIFVKDCQGRYLLFNEAAAQLTGFESDTVIGRDDTFLFRSETAANIMESDRVIMGEGALQTQEAWLTLNNGTRMASSTTKGPVFGQDGKISGVFGIARDITARKEMEEALKKSEERFRTYIENAPLAILVTDYQGKFTDANPAAVQLFGYGRESLLALGIFALTHREDLEHIRHDFKEMHFSGHLGGEYRMMTQDGRTLWVSIKGIQMGENQCMAYFQDITDRKDAEKTQQLNMRLLELIHTYTHIPELLDHFVHEIKVFTGCEAVGIRVLDDHGNIPYQAYEGFSAHFFETESPLSIKSDRCMCISVIKGDIDAHLPFYTQGGSFYMNGTSRFLTTVSEKDKGETRNVCNMTGYESVALVPFRSEGRVSGLIHVADHRENMVPLSVVQILERAVMQLGTVFERTRAQMKVRESEERLRSIMDNAGRAIWVKDLEGRFLMVNNFFLDVLGKSKQEVLGYTNFDLLPRRLAEERTQNDRLVIESGLPLEGEELFVMADGYHTFLSVKFPLCDEKGKAYALSAISTDVTRLKNAEASLKHEEEKYRQLSQEYKVLLDNVPDGIVHLSPHLEIRWVNSAAQKMFDLENGPEFQGKTCFSAFWKMEERCLSCPVVQSVSSGRSEMGEISLNDERKYEIRAVPVVSESGEIEGVIEIIRDISAHRKLEEQFRQAQKMESIGTLAGGIAHDFNNILSAILGYGEILLDDMDKDDPRRENVETIMEAGFRATRLTKDLLLFSRKQINDKQTIDLNEVITRVEKFIRRIIGEDIQCATNLAKRPMLIFGDGHQIEQVLMNFATNARDAMPAGGNFSIATDFLEFDADFIENHGFGNPGMYVSITVSDTGKGMDKQTSEKIFEPFFTTKGMGKGTGLGLAVVYGIIKEHNGYINVYSEPEEGTVFRVYLPMLQEGKHTDQKLAGSEKPRRGQETILLAEDEETVRRLFRTLLIRYGYTVIEAVNGEDAVRKFEENRDSIDLLLFDLVMPKMDGKKAFEQIKLSDKSVKGIFVSGYAPENIQRKDLFNLNTKILFKPVSPSELLRTIRKVLDEPLVDVEAD